MKRLFIHHWGLKLVSILLGITVWWLIREERARQDFIPFQPRPPAKTREISIQE